MFSFLQNISLLIFCFVLFSCGEEKNEESTSKLTRDIKDGYESRKHFPVSDSVEFQKLVELKYHYDTLVINDELTRDILIKLEDSDEVIWMDMSKYPDNLEKSWNIYFDDEFNYLNVNEGVEPKEGIHIFIVYYFHEDGKTFAVSRWTIYEESECTGLYEYEIYTQYFDSNSMLIGTTLIMQDTYEQPLDYEECDPDYNYFVKIPKSIEEYFSWIGYKK